MQVFSAFSFYESQGDRLVADIQGVGDLFTDPQVLSSDYRFGDGDLGPRGMALFFHSFRHNTVATALGIPFFPLSKSELNNQSKYEDNFFSMLGNDPSLVGNDDGLNRFEKMDLNRCRRQSVLMIPAKESLPDDQKDTEKRSNQAGNVKTKFDSRPSVYQSCKPASLTRTKSVVDEVKACLDLAKDDFEFDKTSYFRNDSGDLLATLNNPPPIPGKRSSLIVRRVSDTMVICDSTKLNLGRVHYQLAVLHGMGRFAEDGSTSPDDAPSHDAFSVLFHLCHASSLRCVPACLALGRVLTGLGTCVSNLLDSLVPIDFDGAKCLLKRAMESEFPPNGPKLAAASLLYQIYTDENGAAREDFLGDNEDGDGSSTKSAVVSDLELINLLQDILDLIAACEDEKKTNLEFKERSKIDSYSFRVGDKVEGNYFLEGKYYPGVVDSVSNDGAVINIKYDDDGTIESLSSDNVRMLIPPTATQTALGGPLTDEEAGFGGGSDETITVESYQMKADLAQLVEKAGNNQKASKLYEEAAHEAMLGNKMKLASEWSLKASNLLQ